MKTEIANVIELRKSRPMVSSLKIAELFDRPHKNVLRVLRELSGLAADDANLAAQKDGLPKRGRGKNIKISASVLDGKIHWDSYVDERGKTHPIAWLSEREALIAMPFFGGRKAQEGQRKLVDAYLYYRDNFANPPRKDILAAKRAAHHPMMDALVEARADEGKGTESHHFTCENRLCNWVVTGKFAAVDESALSNEEVELLRLVRERNAAFIASGLTYDVRKPKLAAYGMKIRNRAAPRIAA